MNALASVIALVLALLVGQNPARDARLPTDAPASTIRGRVLTDAGEPVRKARVGLAAEGHDEGWPVFTDPYGRFQFAGLTAGRYILTVSKAGYVTTRFGARQPLEPAVPLDVSAGTILDNVDVRLARGAAIGGHIVDEDGSPVIDCAVSAGRLVRSANGLKVVTLKSTTTDDLGEYRLPELPRGSYVVFADPRSSLLNRMTVVAMTGRGGGMSIGGLRRTSGLSRLFFPAALSQAQAQILSVQPAEELTSIDMMLRPVEMPHLTLTIADAGATTPRVRYEVAPDEPTDEMFASSGVIRNGEPEVMPAFPGGWNVLVNAAGVGGAYLHFTMGESDETMAVALKPFVTVSGRLLVDGRARSGDPRTMIEIVPTGSLSRGPAIASPFARPNPDGTFSVDAIQGAMEVRLRNAPAGWMLQSIGIGDRVLPDTRLDLGSDPITNMTLQISTQPADLSGTVSDPSGEPVSGDSIVVFPKNAALLDNPDRWTRWIKADVSGHFAIRDLPAGDFDVVALRDVDDALWQTPAYLDALRPQATAVTLAVGRPVTVSLVAKAPR